MNKNNLNISVVCISDTHNRHNQIKKLPPADFIIHAGDFTSMGHDHEIRNFMDWFSNLNQYKHKIIIAGNHDILFEKEKTFAKSLIPDNINYLEDEEIIINGIKIYGSPVQLPFANGWVFNRNEYKLMWHWANIPNDVDILITHCPPYMIMDYSDYGSKHIGSPALYDEVLNRIKPKLHCFGHAHQMHGIKKIDETYFINATVVDNKNKYLNDPIYIEI